MKIEDMNIEVVKKNTKHGIMTQYYQDGTLLKRKFGPRRGEIIFLEGKDNLRIVEVMRRETGDNLFTYQYLDTKDIETSYGYFYEIN